MARGIPSEVLRHVHAIPLFHGASRRGVRAVISAATELEEPAGKVLVKEGETGREMYVLVEGSARVSRRGRMLADLGPGDFFGELAFLDHAPRSATVTALTDVAVMILGPREMEVIVDTEPSMLLPMLKAMSRRIRESERVQPL